MCSALFRMFSYNNTHISENIVNWTLSRKYTTEKLESENAKIKILDSGGRRQQLARGWRVQSTPDFYVEHNICGDNGTFLSSFLDNSRKQLLRLGHDFRRGAHSAAHCTHTFRTLNRIMKSFSRAAKNR